MPSRTDSSPAYPLLAALQAIAQTSRPFPLTPDQTVTELIYDPATELVTCGMYRGLTVGRAAEIEHGHLNETYALVSFRTVTVRPWWRRWRPTPALRLTGSCPRPPETA